MGLGSGHIGFPSPSATDSSSWTDDLPICTATGVGFSPNQIYRRDGHRSTDHELEDQSFHFRLDDDISLYGVFDGHCGAQAARFAVQRIPAEILLGQLSERSTEAEIREVLRQAFLSVEREYFDDTIGTKLAERATLLSEMPEGLHIYDTFQDYPLRKQLEELNLAVASGTTACVVLIFHGKLFVSNVGDSRAVLCCTEKGCGTDGTGMIRVVQLSVDHDLNNDEELRRLHSLNLDVNRLKHLGWIGNQTNTRCLGNYLVKGGYKEIDLLASARSEPVIAIPTVHNGVSLDNSCRFLLLLSDGLYKALAEASDGSQVNSQLAQMVVEEFGIQSTLTGVAQAVVDKVSRMHHDLSLADLNAVSTTQRVTKREDMTLLVRNFNFPIPNSISSPVNGKTPPFPMSRHESMVSTPTNSTNHFDSTISTLPKIILSSPHNTTTLSNTEASTSTESSDLLTQSIQKLNLDDNGRIAPYVDFGDYYRFVGANNTNSTQEEASSSSSQQ